MTPDRLRRPTGPGVAGSEDSGRERGPDDDGQRHGEHHKNGSGSERCYSDHALIHVSIMDPVRCGSRPPEDLMDSLYPPVAFPLPSDIRPFNGGSRCNATCVCPLAPCILASALPGGHRPFRVHAARPPRSPWPPCADGAATTIVHLSGSVPRADSHAGRDPVAIDRADDRTGRSSLAAQPPRDHQRGPSPRLG